MTVPLGLNDHEERLGRRAISIGPIIDDEAHRFLGLMIRLHGFSFYFFMESADREEPANDEITRPDIIDMIGPERTSRIYLSWRRENSPGQLVEVRVSRSRGKIRVPTDPITPLGQASSRQLRSKRVVL